MSTANKNLNIPSNNSYINNWDIPMNTNFNGIDYALAGACYISASGRSGSVTMGGSYSSVYPYPPDNIGSSGTPTTSASPSYIPSNIIISGGYSANITLNVPLGIKGQWTVYNNGTPTGSQTISFGVLGGDSVVVPVGQRVYVVSDGADMAYAQEPTITLGSTGLTLGSTVTSVYNLTLENPNINDSTLDNATINSGSINIDALDATGTANSTTFLRGDGAWSVPETALSQIYDLQATGTSNQIQITLAPCTLTFRSTSVSASPETVTTTSSTTFTLPTTASLGATSGQAIRFVVFAYKTSATTIVLGVGGTFIDVDESVTVNTAVVSGGTSGTTYYADSTLSGVPYRVVGFIDAVWTTGVGWSAPSLVQGAGGNALSAGLPALNSFGYGQTWYDVTGSRAAGTTGTTYTNSTGKPIMVCVRQSTGGNLTAYVNGLSILSCASSNPSYKDSQSNTFVVPPGSTYRVDGDVNLWTELR